MDEIDVIGRIADKRKPHEKEGIIQQVHAASVTVKPVGSFNTVECAYNNVNPALVGKRCTYLWVNKKYVISHIFNAPNQTDITVPAGSSHNDHTLYDNIGGQILKVAEKTTPVDDDLLLMEDSEDSYRKKRVPLSALAAFISGMSVFYQTIRDAVSDFSQRSSLAFLNGVGTAAVVNDNLVDDQTEVQYDLDFATLTELGTADPVADFLAIYDNSASAYKKVKPTNLGSTGAGDFLADGSVPMTGDFNLQNHAIKIDDISSPGTPASGKFIIYLKSDGKLYVKNDAGAEKLVAGDFFRDGSATMLGDLDINGSFIRRVDQIFYTSRSTPSPPSGGQYTTWVDQTLFRPKYYPASGAEMFFLMDDGSVPMAANFNLDAHAVLLDDISTPGSNPPSGKYLLYLKSDGNLYLLDHSGTETQITGGAGGSGSTITSDDYSASRPGFPSDGDMFVARDGRLLEVYHDSGWNTYLGGQRLYYPGLAASWTQTNFSAYAILDDDKGSLLLRIEGQTGDNLRIVTHAAPTAPYTISALVEVPMVGAEFIFCGICLRDSGSGRVLGFGQNNQDAINLRIMSWINENSYDGGYGVPTLINQPAHLPFQIWLRITDDGTSRSYYWSIDGSYWTFMYDDGDDTVPLVADEVGFYVNFNNASLLTSFRVLSWQES